MKLLVPVVPYRGVRGTDSWGAGNFGASRDGGSRFHKGLDFLTVAGDDIVAPIAGRVSRLGVAYESSPKGGDVLGSLWLDGLFEYALWRVHLLYVRPEIAVGMTVAAGDALGFAQDVAAYWKWKMPEHPGEMRNHLHVELYNLEPLAVDPSHYLAEGLTVPTLET
jgi:hypothetical protein